MKDIETAIEEVKEIKTQLRTGMDKVYKSLDLLENVLEILEIHEGRIEKISIGMVEMNLHNQAQ